MGRRQRRLCLASVIGLFVLAGCVAPHDPQPPVGSPSAVASGPVSKPMPGIGTGTSCPPAAAQHALLAAYRAAAATVFAGQSGVERLPEQVGGCTDSDGRLSLAVPYEVPESLWNVDLYLGHAAGLAGAGWLYAGQHGDDQLVDFCARVHGYPTTLRIARGSVDGPDHQIVVTLAAACHPWPVAAPESPAPMDPVPRRTYRPSVPDGSLRWRIRLGAPVSAPPSGVAGAILVATGAPYIDNNLYRLDPRSGKELWRTRLPGPVQLQTSDGVDSVYLVTSYPGRAGSQETGLLHAIDARSGRLRWVAAVRPAQFTNLVTDGRRVYLAESDRQVAAFDAATGAPSWRVREGSGDYTALVAVAGSVYIGNVAAPAVALNAATGRVRWRSTQAIRYNSGIGATASHVYVCDYTTLYALDAAGGKQLWRNNFVNCWRNLIELDGTVYSSGASTTALDAATGKPRWDPFEAPAYTTVALTGGRIYGAGDQTGLFYALDIGTGKIVWAALTDLTYVAAPQPAVVLGNVVCVTGGSGTVWAFRT